MISGKGVLKRLGNVTSTALYVMRGFEEDVQPEDVFASTTLTAPVRMLLLFAIDLRSEGHYVHSRPLPEWSRQTLDSNVGAVCRERWRKACVVCEVPQYVGRNTRRTS